jgi:DNA-directed RNA polymerase subunit H (RpoH/RPB5)
MSFRSVEFMIYGNLTKYVINILGCKIDSKQLDKKQFEKSMQFDSYIKIRATDNSKIPLYAFIIKDNEIVSKSGMFKKLMDNVPEKEIRIIIISRNAIKFTIVKYLKAPKRKIITYKSYLYDSFKNSITTNVLVHPHTLLTIDETAKLLEDNELDSVNRLPKISKKDAQIIQINGDIGQVVKIVRSDVTGPVVYYRVIK